MGSVPVSYTWQTWTCKACGKMFGGVLEADVLAAFSEHVVVNHKSTIVTSAEQGGTAHRAEAHAQRKPHPRSAEDIG